MSYVKMSLGEVRSLIIAEVKPKKKSPAAKKLKPKSAPKSPRLPTLADAESVVADCAYRSKGGLEAFKRLCVALNAAGATDIDMMIQYVQDARLPDGNEQKEGMDTSDYLDMAQDDLRAAYAELGLT